MNQEQRNQLAAAILDCAHFYGKTDLSTSDIKSFIDVLIKFYSEISASGFINGLLAYVNDAKNRVFPAPSTLRPYLYAKMDDDFIAVQAASRALEAVSKFGWNNSTEARVYVGELGWKAIAGFGGWSYVCENLGNEISLTTFQAQVREIAKSIIKMTKAGLESGPVEIPYKEKLIASSDVDFNLSNRKNEEIGKLLDFLAKKNTEGEK